MTAREQPTIDRPKSGAEYVLSSTVIFLAVDDGSARLLDLDGNFYALPAVGAAMLRTALAEGVEPAVRRIAAEYVIDAARVRADLLALLCDLRRQGLVHQLPARGRSRPLRAIAATAMIYPILRLLALVRSRSIYIAALLIWARCCFALFGWAQTVQGWRSCLRSAKTCPPRNRDEAITAIDETVRDWAARLPLTACKERALCCWFLLCATGIRATLMAGVQLFPLTGHCWCQVGSRILTDFADRCESFTPIARYDAPPAASRAVLPPEG